jgi:hypothetical protein
MRHYEGASRRGTALFFERRPGGWYLCGDDWMEEKIEDLRTLYGNAILFATDDTPLAIRDPRDE